MAGRNVQLGTHAALEQGDVGLSMVECPLTQWRGGGMLRIRFPGGCRCGLRSLITSPTGASHHADSRRVPYLFRMRSSSFRFTGFTQVAPGLARQFVSGGGGS